MLLKMALNIYNPNLNTTYFRKPFSFFFINRRLAILQKISITATINEITLTLFIELYLLKSLIHSISSSFNANYHTVMLIQK